MEAGAGARQHFLYLWPEPQGQGSLRLMEEAMADFTLGARDFRDIAPVCLCRDLLDTKSLPVKRPNREIAIMNNRFRAVSSAVEHCPHTTRVTGSNPVLPTSFFSYRRPLCSNHFSNQVAGGRP